MAELPASKVIDTKTGPLEYIRAGEGSPAVVLINGSGGPLAGWYRVLPALAAATTTLAYNRPGIGRSARPSRPQTVSAMVEDLHNLLVELAVPAPWILVGHSFGGLVANLFARSHAQSVAGVVLLEATAPDDVALLKAHENVVQRGLGWIANKLFPLHPDHETRHAMPSVEQLAEAPAFPPLPLAVVTGAQPALAWATSAALLALRRKHQLALVRLSAQGQHVEARRSGHFPQLSEPELVTSVILDMVDRAAGQHWGQPSADAELHDGYHRS